MNTDNLYTYLSKCLRVIDGDTFAAEIDLGFRLKVNAPVRLAGINTPELRPLQPGAEDARDALAELLYSGGGEFLLRSVELDKYGRVLGRVILADGRDVAQTLINRGHGVPMKG